MIAATRDWVASAGGPLRGTLQVPGDKSVSHRAVMLGAVAEGGVAEFARRNARKAALLYQVIDGSGGFYSNPVALAARSRMNVPFFLRDPALDPVFLADAKAGGRISLKGHRALGGMRASIYNAMPEAGVQALADFMQAFQQRHG